MRQTTIIMVARNDQRKIPIRKESATANKEEKIEDDDAIKI
jgi:hypothetical protein